MSNEEVTFDRISALRSLVYQKFSEIRFPVIDEIEIPVELVLDHLRMSTYEQLDFWLQEQSVLSGFIWSGNLVITHFEKE